MIKRRAARRAYATALIALLSCSSAVALAQEAAPKVAAPAAASPQPTTKDKAAAPAAKEAPKEAPKDAPKSPVEAAADAAADAAASRHLYRGARLPLHSKATVAKPVTNDETALEKVAVKIAERLAKSHGAKEAQVEKKKNKTDATTLVFKTRTPTPQMKAAALAKPLPPRVPAVTGPQPPVFTYDWAYSGEHGPDAWHRLNPEFATCNSGQQQSPIDIKDGLAVDQDPLQFDYRPSGLAVIDTGHTVEGRLTRGNVLSALGRQYELETFHFHLPAEERINGAAFDMVVHLVHKNRQGQTAVVAVLLQQGAAHPAIQLVWNNMPLEKNEEMRTSRLLDPLDLLPQDRRYYAYMGSLTTPPCSEGVLWIVLKQPLTVSPEQMRLFARLYPMNARPIQASAGRLIRESR